MDRARGHGLLFLTCHTMGQFSKLTEGFDQTKNSCVACGKRLGNTMRRKFTLKEIDVHIMASRLFI
jgi:hypothetical protein